MPVKFSLKDETETWRGIGKCMNDGDIILSPFEQPIEEERRGDPDQYDDNRNFEPGDVCEVVESLGPAPKKIAAAPPDRRFRYFLDGSIRTKYIGEYVEGPLSLPLIVSDISVAVVEVQKSRLVPSRYRKHVWFVFPHKDTGMISDTTYERIKEISEQLESTNSLTRIDFLKRGDVIGDIRGSLLGKVRNLMHIMEQEVAAEITQKEDGWLIMDGAIRKHEFIDLNRTIGLAKSFSRKPIFDISDKQVTLPAYMKQVSEGFRSAVFKKTAAKDSVYKEVVFWYIRLRNFPPMEPLGGLVKVDFKATEYDSDFTDLVNEISAELYAMRLPSVYPWPRWPSYVYPIRVAELFMASRFLGDFVLGEVGNQLKKAITTK